MTTRKAIIVGPFSRGINTFDDPTAIHDQECAEALNFDPGLDGSLKSRPPFTDTGDYLGLDVTGIPKLLGYFYDSAGVPYLIASDGYSSTYAYHSGNWTLISNTFAAADMTQFNGRAWLVAPVGEASPGGYWTPSGGFTADSDMPKGSSITSYKSRLWVAQGIGGTNPTRIYYSKVLGQPSFWASAAFLDVGSGDGQNIVKIITYYDTMLVFRTKSIWSFQYGTDPASAIQGVIVPGVGLQSRHALVSYENYLYFMYDEKAYEFVNNRVSQINIKVPFRTNNPGSTDNPYTVSLFNNRVLFSYYETIYVYSLRTQTWTTWRSDVWGPIGQLMMPYTDADTDIAYAIPSGSVPPSAVIARNRALNPSFQVSTGKWGASTGSPSFIRKADGTVPGHETFMSVTITAAGSSTMRAENAPAVPGETLSVMVDVRATTAAGGGPLDFQVSMNCIDGGTEGAGNGSLISPAQSSPWVTVDPSEGWVTLRLNAVTTYEDTDFVRFYVGVRGASVGQVFHIDNLRWDVAPNGTDPLADYFDGSTAPSDPAVENIWDGVAGLSSSSQRTSRAISLLKIEDRVTGGKEDMLCVLRTKNYNFDVPGSFKVLFWWGIDAIFKTEIQGQVIPGVYNLSTTWGKLFTEAISWGTILGGTWAHPYLSDSSVTTDVNAGPGPFRKFVKFMKKLRFRQLQFRVTFKTDGSDATAPVQIFTLSTYMTEKQTVSKTIS